MNLTKTQKEALQLLKQTAHTFPDVPLRYYRASLGNTSKVYIAVGKPGDLKVLDMSRQIIEGLVNAGAIYLQQTFPDASSSTTDVWDVVFEKKQDANAKLEALVRFAFLSGFRAAETGYDVEGALPEEDVAVWYDNDAELQAEVLDFLAGEKGGEE